MTTPVVLSPTPILAFLDNQGNVAAGGLLTTTVGGIPYPTYSEPTGVTQLPNPIVLNNRGEIATSTGQSSPLFVQANVNYNFQLTDSLGNLIWNQPYLNGVLTVITQASIGQTLWPPSPGEIAAGINPPNQWRFYGDVQRYGADPLGVVDSTAALNNCLIANAGYYPVVAYGGTYVLSGQLTAPANTSIVLAGATLQWTATALTGPLFPAGVPNLPTRNGINVAGSNFSIQGNGKILGPSPTVSGVSTQITGENGIFAQGISLASAFSGFYIGPGIEVANWGQRGILVQYVNDVRIIGCKIHDCGYAGFQNLCGVRSVVHGNEVYNMALGCVGNAYGIGHTTDSNNYGALGRADLTPFCFDVDVAFNYVHDIPLWAAIDYHGNGYDSRTHHNSINNCCIRISCASSPSSTGGSYGGENALIDHNVININQRNGAATTVLGTSFPLGIVANGGANISVNGISVVDNIIIGYGNSTSPPTAYPLQCQNAVNATIARNTFRSCQGYLVYLANTDGATRDNHFDALGAAFANSSCIFAAINVTHDITGNKHRIPSGQAAQYGCYINTPADGPYLLAGNDFDSALNSPYGQAGGALSPVQMRGQSDNTPAILTSAVTGTVAVPVGYGPEVDIILSNASPYALTTITGAFIGQKINLRTTTANAVTVASSASIKLNGGVSWVSTNNSFLSLKCVNTAGVMFGEIGRGINS